MRMPVGVHKKVGSMEFVEIELQQNIIWGCLLKNFCPQIKFLQWKVCIVYVVFFLKDEIITISIELNLTKGYFPDQ